MGLREIDPSQVDPVTWKVSTPRGRPSADPNCGETTRLLEVDWKQQAEKTEQQRRRAHQQEERLYRTLLEPAAAPTEDPNESRHPLVAAVAQLVDKYPLRMQDEDNAAFFLGMLRWLQTQLGEQYFCRWRIHQHEFIESRDPEFMLDALRVLRRFCKTHHTTARAGAPRPAALPDDNTSNRVPTWFIFSVQPDCHDLDVELVIKRLPREFLLKAANPMGEVDVKTGVLRGASMLGHPLFCCGMFFCIPFPGMYASCITARHQHLDNR